MDRIWLWNAKIQNTFNESESSYTETPNNTKNVVTDNTIAFKDSQNIPVMSKYMQQAVMMIKQAYKMVKSGLHMKRSHADLKDLLTKCNMHMQFHIGGLVQTLMHRWTLAVIKVSECM